MNKKKIVQLTCIRNINRKHNNSDLTGQRALRRDPPSTRSLPSLTAPGKNSGGKTTAKCQSPILCRGQYRHSFHITKV